MPTPFPTHPCYISTIFALIFFPLSTLAGKTCSTYYCGGANGGDSDSYTVGQPQAIRFPFFAAASNQSVLCGYPGFNLSCNRQNQPLINLGSSGEFIVQEIDYTKQVISISDPNQCLPNLILSLNLSDSPFACVENHQFTLFNCSNSPNSSLPQGILELFKISCPSGQTYTIVPNGSEVSYNYLSNSSECRQIKQVSLPGYLGPDYPFDLDFLQLSWSVPNCSVCESNGETCGFEGDSGLTVACHGSGSGRVLPRGVEYGLVLGIGIPALACSVLLVLIINSKIITHRLRHHRSNTEFSLSIFRQPTVIASGLDTATIESYPKTVLGESRRLPEPCNDGTCSICLSEYAPQETLRIIPECNHCFHAQCIDKWLKENATCPLCRNSPQKPATVAACCLPATSSATRSTPESVDFQA